MAPDDPKRRPLSKRDPVGDATRCGHYGGLRKNGTPCVGLVVKGTQRCRMHGGKPLASAKAQGAVVIAARQWGLTDTSVDPGEYLLRLVSQSARRVEMYAGLLQRAYEAAERLQAALKAEELIAERPEAYDDEAPDPALQTAYEDIRRIFNTGGVAALIGFQFDTTKDGSIYATGEAIRGLAQLEMQERRLGMDLASKAVAAGLAERMVRLAERQGQLMAQFVERVAERLGLTDDQRAVLPAAIEAEVINMTGEVAA